MSALLNGRSQAKTLPADRPRAVPVALALGDLRQVQRHPGGLVETHHARHRTAAHSRRSGGRRGVVLPQSVRMERVMVAAVQAAPVFLDREATIDKAVRPDRQGGGQRRRPGGLPRGLRARPTRTGCGGPSRGATATLYARLFDQSVTVPGPATERLGGPPPTGRRLRVHRDQRAGRAGQHPLQHPAYLGPDGAVLGTHRKLMPTGGERLVWGMGDGSGARPSSTPRSAAWAGSSAGRTTCPWPGPPSTRRASTSTWPRPGTTPTCGSPPSATSPRRAGCTWWASPPASAAPTCPPTCPARRDVRRRRRLAVPGQHHHRRPRRRDPGRPPGRGGGHPLRRARRPGGPDGPPALRPRRPLRPARRVPPGGRPPAQAVGGQAPTHPESARRAIELSRGGGGSPARTRGSSGR